MAKTTLKKPSAGKSRASGTMASRAKPAKRTSSPDKSAAMARSAARVTKKTVVKDKSAGAKANRPGSGRNAQPLAQSGRAGAEQTLPPANLNLPAGDNGKKRKNAAGFSPRDLDNFRELLLAKRREILGDLRSMEHEALRTSGGSNLSNLPIHMADMGTDNYEQEFTLGLVEKDRQMLREINAALIKIQDGTYGICEGTGKPIGKERLEYQPWARFSIEYARKMERMGRPGVL